MSTLLANQGVQAAIAAILVQFGVILGIFAAYFKVRTTQAVQGEKIDSVEKQQAKQGPAMLVTPMPTVAATTAPAPAVAAQPTAAGGGMAPLIVPAWSQAADLASGGMSPTGQIDCGYECVAMALRIMTGVQVPAAYLRWQVKGPGDTSLATADDLVQAFAVDEHAAHRRDAPFDALKVELAHCIAARKPALVLGRWLGPEGHWMVCEQVDDARGVLFRDPWGGPQYWLPWPVVQQRYEGTYVHVDERASYQP